jgi:hypothetical protein
MDQWLRRVAPAVKLVIVRLRFTKCFRSYFMAQSSPQPSKQSKRRSSATRFLRSAAAAGLSIRSIEFDPITGKCTVLVGDSAPAKAPVEDVDLDRELEG